MLLFPKSSHSIQHRACFIQSPARAVFPSEGRAPAGYLHIKSNQAFPWWGNHSGGVGSRWVSKKSKELSGMYPGTGDELSSAMGPCSWHSGERKSKQECQRERNMVLVPQIKGHYWHLIPLSELDQEINLIRAEEPLRNQGQGWVSEQGRKKGLCNKFKRKQAE